MPRTMKSADGLFTRLYMNLFAAPSRRPSRKTVAAPVAVLEQKVLLAGFQDFDSNAAGTLPAGWFATTVGGNMFTTVAGSTDAGPNRVFVAGPATVSDSNLLSPSVLIDGSNGRLSFRHAFNMESGFDGGVLEISVSGGAFQDIIKAGGTFVAGGYNETINEFFGSPLAKRSAWTGDSVTYMTTTVDVPVSALGKSVQFRWRAGTDSTTSSPGWSIDTITLNQLPDPDDQIGEIATATTLNTIITSSLAHSLDVNLYKFTVTAGQTLQFDLDTQGQAIPLTDSILRIFNSAGTALNMNDDGVGPGTEGNVGDSFLQHTFAAAGTYYVGVSAFNNFAYNATTGDGDTPSNEPVGGYVLNIGSAPKATITMSNTNLREHGKAVVTFTFDQPVTGFTNADLTIPNGTMTNVVSANGGITWTATFTPTPNFFDATNVITLNQTGVLDLVGTPGVGNAVSPNFAIDTIVDENDQISEASLVLLNTSTTAAIDKGLDVDMYAVDVTAGQIVQFDIDTQGFGTPLDDSYLRVFNAAGTQIAWNDEGVGYGTEGNVKESFLQWTFAAAGRYYIAISGFNNTAFNATTGDGDANSTLTGSYILHIGTAPTATITMSDYDLLPGETAVVTVTFSEPVIGFTNSDLTIVNGNLTPVSSADGGKTWTATYTPTVGVYDTTNVVTLNNAGVTDTVGTPGAGTTSSANYSIGLAYNTAMLVPNPYVPGGMALLVNGTLGNDVITVTRPTTNTYTVVINNVNKGTFTSPNGIMVLGQDGNDKITLATNITLDSILDGGIGDDTINGGGSNSVMLGGAGKDTLTGFGALVGGADNDILKSSGGRSLMIGGTGADSLTSQFGNDILIGGATDHDTNIVALYALRSEWNLNTSVATRIAHLAGLAGGGLNGGYYLISDAVRPGTVHNDFASDKLLNNSSNDWLLPFSGDVRSKIIGQVNHA